MSFDNGLVICALALWIKRCRRLEYGEEWIAKTESEKGGD